MFLSLFVDLVFTRVEVEFEMKVFFYLQNKI